MGKASKWFRGLLGLKKPDPTPNQTPNHPHKTSIKKKWSFAKSHKDNDPSKPQHAGINYEYHNANRQAVAVAAATARVAEAAVAAAQVAAVAVKHSNKGKNASTTEQVSHNGAGYGLSRKEWAAVTIQSHFRAYLARRALRALKALVKIQALVRGHLIRKRTTDALRQLQALVRAQARARVGRALTESPHSSIKSSQFNYSGPQTPEKFEYIIRARSMSHEHSMMLKRNGSKSNSSLHYDPPKSHLSQISRLSKRLSEQGSYSQIILTDDEKSGKILEVDTGKPHVTPKRRNLFRSSHLSLGSDQNSLSFSTSKDSTAHQAVLSPSCEVQSLNPLEFEEENETAFCTADNSPHFYSASSMACSSKREAFTPTKSDGSRSYLSNYSDHPSYMAYTESSKAKVRSLSAPKQRPQYERSSSVKRYSVHGYGDSRSTQRVPALHANFAGRAYPGSGRLDRHGMPVKGDLTGFSGGHWLRY